MTPTTLQTVGRALYGPCWQRELARQLDVSDRTVNRWVAGVYQIPEGVAVDLIGLCAEKIKSLEWHIEHSLQPTNTDTKKDASDE